ncbi:MAG TPA: pitrilysin family protein [Methylomirabilota bacterium]|nr:pitrilysin family protein [Methylomirabilota bacterium]
MGKSFEGQPIVAPEEIPALPPGVRLTTLDNGLVLIVREDPSAPVVSAQAWCKAGAIDEGRWLGSGMSHMLEHMLFKGTSTRAVGRIDQEVQEAGGYMNAYTSFDRTVYWINVPNTGGRIAIDILCDIMRNAILPEEEVEKEKQVILREMDMNQDDPGRRSSRRLFETAYVRSPYRYTVIGYPDIFQDITRDDIVAYYREKYTPNNIFFVVVGDVKAAEVEAQITEAFRTAKSKPLPPIAMPPEPTQTSPRELIEEAAIELGHFHFAWHIPDVRHRDIPALDVVATLLGSGHSSRLYQEVRERQGVVHSVDAWTYNPGNPGLFGLSGIVDPDKFDAARSALLQQIERLKHELVTQAELTKAVKQFTAATLATRKTMQGQAQDLGNNWLAANDLNFSERYLAAVKRLKPEDLRRAAQEYLHADNRTLYALLPLGGHVKKTISHEKIADQPIHKLILPNGLTLLVKEDHRLPFVEFRNVFRGGVLVEDTQSSGITLLLAKMLMKGTPTRTAEQLATEIETLGGSMDVYGGNNSFGANAEALSSDFDQALEIIADVLLNPSFPEAALEREKQVQLAGIRAHRDHLLQSASKSMRRELFGRHGYGLDVHGSEESVRAMTVERLQAFRSRVLVPNNCVMAIYGDVQLDQVRASVERLFGNWKRAENVPLDPTPPVSITRPIHTMEHRDKKQAVLVMGFPGVSIHDPDRYPLELLQEALSDLGSRLFLRIRENLGLAYYVGAQHFIGLKPGYFALYAGTNPENVELVEKEMFVEIEDLRANGLTADELRRAKAKLLGQKKIARQDLGSYAIATALDELYGLGFLNCDAEDTLYERVTLEQISHVARKYLTPEACVVSVVKPAVPETARSAA